MFACRRILTVAALGVALCAGAAEVNAQVALDDDSSPSPTAPATETKVGGTKIGLGLRLRNVRIPKSLIEIFVEHAPSGTSNVGFGAELSRRKGNFEVQFGLEYEKISMQSGLWVDKGDDISMGDEPDFVEFDGFSWVTAELSFMYHTPIIDQLAVRYGGGAGIGVFMGDIRRTDYVCDNGMLDDQCHERTNPPAENLATPYDLPPVMIVINAIVGVQIKPTDEIFINVEGGIRTMPFFGMTAGYYF